MNAPFSAQTPDAPQPILFTAAMRTLIADAIQSLILLLDEIDGDAECEECDSAEENGDLDSSLGARAGMDQRRTWRATGSAIEDAEAEHDGREPDAELEAMAQI
jgi:hypothetical protein